MSQLSNILDVCMAESMALCVESIVKVYLSHAHKFFLTGLCAPLFFVSVVVKGGSVPER